MQASSKAWGIVSVVLLVLVVVISVTVFNAAIPSTTSSETQNNTRSARQNSTVSNTQYPNSVAVTIIFSNNGFSQTKYTVKSGETVAVKNNSSMSLQFSSDDHPTHTHERELNLGTLAPGETGTFMPTKVGNWGFHDHIHDEFTGTLEIIE